MKSIAVSLSVALCTGCASNDALLLRMDRAEQSLSVVAGNEAYFNGLLKDQARVQQQLDAALRRLEAGLTNRQQSQMQELAEIRQLVLESARITKRIDIRRVGDANLIVVKD